MDKLIEVVRLAYSENIKSINGEKTTISVSDTLVSKILLGIFGNVPAYDRFFVTGMKMHGLNNTSFNEESLISLLEFYNDNQKEFIRSQELFKSKIVPYTPMKLMDMYFWQVGYMMSDPENFSEEELQAICSFAEENALKNKKRENIAIPNQHTKTMNGRLIDVIKQHILEIIIRETRKGSPYVDLISGDIHKEMNLKNKFPSVCNAMIRIEDIDFEVLQSTPSGKSSTIKIRYWLQGRKINHS